MMVTWCGIIKMDMKQIKTKAGKILCVKVPKDIDLDTLSYSTSQDLHLLTTTGKDVDIYCNNIPDIKILGKLSELTDKDCEEFVELTNTGLYKLYNWSQEKISNLGIQPITNYAKKSFTSLLQSEGIDTSNEDKLLIIKLL